MAPIPPTVSTKPRWRIWPPPASRCTPSVSGPEQPQNDLELTQLQLPSTAVAGSTVRATRVDPSPEPEAGPRAPLRRGPADRRAGRAVHRYGRALRPCSWSFPAGESGVRDLRAAVDAAPSETRLGNNERHAVMEVDGTRRSVLYIEGEPRWEYKFIRRAVEGDRKLRAGQRGARHAQSLLPPGPDFRQRARRRLSDHGRGAVRLQRSDHRQPRSRGAVCTTSSSG